MRFRETGGVDNAQKQETRPKTPEITSMWQNRRLRVAEITQISRAQYGIVYKFQVNDSGELSVTSRNIEPAQLLTHTPVPSDQPGPPRQAVGGATELAPYLQAVT